MGLIQRAEQSEQNNNVPPGPPDTGPNNTYTISQTMDCADCLCADGSVTGTISKSLGDLHC